MEGWNEFDAYGMMQQLSAASPPGTSPQMMRVKQ
jgi:hypothetical protein